MRSGYGLELFKHPTLLALICGEGFEDNSEALPHLVLPLWQEDPQTPQPAKTC
jgi:hypothetical protein